MSILKTIIMEFVIPVWVIFWTVGFPLMLIQLSFPRTFKGENPPNKDLVCTQKYDWFFSNERFENCVKVIDLPK